MRLTIQEIIVIKEAIFGVDPDADIYLFGSRTYDEKKGGDIDLLVFSEKITRRELRQIRRTIFDQIGEQKIDIVVEKDVSKPFTQIALERAIRL